MNRVAGIVVLLATLPTASAADDPLQLNPVTGLTVGVGNSGARVAATGAWVRPGGFRVNTSLSVPFDSKKATGALLVDGRPASGVQMSVFIGSDGRRPSLTRTAAEIEAQRLALLATITSEPLTGIAGTAALDRICSTPRTQTSNPGTYEDGEDGRTELGLPNDAPAIVGRQAAIDRLAQKPRAQDADAEQKIRTYLHNVEQSIFDACQQRSSIATNELARSGFVPWSQDEDAHNTVWASGFEMTANGGANAILPTGTITNTTTSPTVLGNLAFGGRAEAYVSGESVDTLLVGSAHFTYARAASTRTVEVCQEAETNGTGLSASRCADYSQLTSDPSWAPGFQVGLSGMFMPHLKTGSNQPGMQVQLNLRDVSWPQDEEGDQALSKKAAVVVGATPFIFQQRDKGPFRGGIASSLAVPLKPNGGNPRLDVSFVFGTFL